MNIIKAVIPAAGLGTRFLPFTKAVPKEMLPLLNKPAIENIIEEGLASHISNFFIITSESKPALERHFQATPKLEAELEKKNKLNMLESTNNIIKNATINYINQLEPLGLGHAISMARHEIGNEYFGVFLPDDIIINHQPAMTQLITVAKKYNATVIAVQEVPRETISSYGVVTPTNKIADGLFEISNVVEKPKPEDAPSNFAIIGRYIFSPRIFEAIDAITPHSQGEVQLTDAIEYLINNGEKVIACVVKGERYDIGQPFGWLNANIHLALNNPKLAPHIKKMLTKKIGDK